MYGFRAGVLQDTTAGVCIAVSKLGYLYSGTAYAMYVILSTVEDTIWRRQHARILYSQYAQLACAWHVEQVPQQAGR